MKKIVDILAKSCYYNNITEKRGKENGTQIITDEFNSYLRKQTLTIKPTHELLESYVNVAINNGIYNDLYKYLMGNGASEELLREFLSF